ncbi:hypothetical protein MSU_0747 [Mycoplasma suis str. Illinois]|uniref:Uncharacterized protein n=1 Tax=Mycoplasma suis (strain Illinois) TaxID=768700 RepID=F0QS02_MYCSL|nr:hypothetical protein MSU_0747 [Mycoplasma suis str. Illinois]
MDCSPPSCWFFSKLNISLGMLSIFWESSSINFWLDVLSFSRALFNFSEFSL